MQWLAPFYRTTVGMVCSGLAAILRPHHDGRRKNKTFSSSEVCVFFLFQHRQTNVNDVDYFLVHKNHHRHV